jgi:hypothetical protein
MHQPRRKRQKDLMRPEAELYRAAGWLGRGFHVYILFLWPSPLVSLYKRHFFLEIYFDAAQFPPAAVWPNAVLCIYTALLCDNAAVLLENIRENVEMISKRKGRRNGALPTVRRSIATAANFFFLYCYMCCSSRAFYIYMYISQEIIYLTAPKDLV